MLAPFYKEAFMYQPSLATIAAWMCRIQSINQSFGDDFLGQFSQDVRQSWLCGRWH